MKKLSITLFAGLCAQLSFAQTPSFTFVELDFSQRKISGTELDGASAKGSWEFADGFFLRGELTTETDDYVDGWGDEIEDTLLYRQLGVGYAIKNESSATYFSLDLGDYNLDHNDSCCNGSYNYESSLTEALTAFSVGHRQNVGNVAELKVELSHLAWDWKLIGHEHYTRGSTSVFFDFNIPVKFGVSYSRIDGLWGEQYQVGARFDF